MGHVVPAFIGQIRLLGHHVAHSARVEVRQLLFLNRGLDALLDFIFRFSSQYQLRPHPSERQHRSSGGRIVANRAAILWIPKLGTVEWTHPRAFYDADKTVFALG